MVSSRSIRRTVHSVRSLPKEDVNLLFRAMALESSVRIALWVVPYRTVRARIDRLSRPRRSGPPPTPRLADRIGWAVRNAARLVPASTCLIQALAASLMLRRAGLPAELHIGVAREGETGLRAHAWVDVDGRAIVGDHDLARLVALRAPSSASDPQPG